MISVAQNKKAKQGLGKCEVLLAPSSLLLCLISKQTEPIAFSAWEQSVYLEVHFDNIIYTSKGHSWPTRVFPSSSPNHSPRCFRRVICHSVVSRSLAWSRYECAWHGQRVQQEGSHRRGYVPMFRELGLEDRHSLLRFPISINNRNTAMLPSGIDSLGNTFCFHAARLKCHLHC